MRGIPYDTPQLPVWPRTTPPFMSTSSINAGIRPTDDVVGAAGQKGLDPADHGAAIAETGRAKDASLALDESGFADVDATVVGPSESLVPDNYPQGLTSHELGQALCGQMLNHFLLEEFIGCGGMGVVFRALDTTLNRSVAVKVVASHRISSEDLQRRFLIEAQSTARLDHPNIARIHYVGRDRDLPYIVFEYIEGQNLRDLLRQRGPLPVGEALGYAYQIANALAHAWERDVVHRDIKPSNILVTPQGQAKLVDMGLARLQHLDALDAELTAAGVALGTLDYVSPEQARNARQADARSDIYSLGCTLFYVLAGQPPFAGGTFVEKVLRHQHEPPPELSDFRADVPPTVHALVQRMLAKNADDRHATPIELVAELAGLMTELGIELPYPYVPAAFSPATIPRPRGQGLAVWGLPVAILLAILPAIDLWYQRGAERASLRLPPLRSANGSATNPSGSLQTSAPKLPWDANGPQATRASEVEIDLPELSWDHLRRHVGDPATTPPPLLPTDVGIDEAWLPFLPDAHGPSIGSRMPGDLQRSQPTWDPNRPSTLESSPPMGVSIPLLAPGSLKRGEIPAPLPGGSGRDARDAIRHK